MDKRIVEIKGVRIGEGMPKICVPLTAPNKEKLALELQGLADAVFDLVEWRVDFYRDFTEESVCLEALSMVRAALRDKPLLFTIRTKNEGGEADISAEIYEKINLAAAKSGMADLIDVELFTAEAASGHLIEKIHEYGAFIVGSSHDFGATPENEEMIRRLRRMQELDMDIAKIAVMPQTAGDVLRLMVMTREMTDTYSDRPLITMSMGRLGAVSRVSGSLTGSALTFGTKGNASAPGQIPAKELSRMLELLMIEG